MKILKKTHKHMINSEKKNIMKNIKKLTESKNLTCDIEFLCSVKKGTPHLPRNGELLKMGEI